MAGANQPAPTESSVVARSKADADPRWRDRAECLGSDPDMFHSVKPGPHAGRAAALAVCQRCLVKETCLEVALGLGDVLGIWGGTSARERRQMRRSLSEQDQTADAEDEPAWANTA